MCLPGYDRTDLVFCEKSVSFLPFFFFFFILFGLSREYPSIQSTCVKEVDLYGVSASTLGVGMGVGVGLWALGRLGI